VTYVIREGRADDVEQCVELGLSSPAPRSAGDWSETFVLDLESPERHLVVAEKAGAIVGYGRASLLEHESQAPDTAPRGYYLTGAFVVPGERRAGIASALARARLEWIGDRAEEAWSFANARNAASIALHKRVGFEEVTREFSVPDLTFEGGEGILFRVRLRAGSAS
jgi:ribosomal protein S18 acetylase RimI-like enzyme